MSETPTIPISDEKTNRVAENADRILNDPYKSAEFFQYAEQHLGPQPRDERWDLNEPVHAFNPDHVPQEAAAYALPPEYIAPPKTRADELAETYNFYDTPALVKEAARTTQATLIMRKLA